MLDKDGHIKIADFGLCKEDIQWGKTTKVYNHVLSFLGEDKDKNIGRTKTKMGKSIH